MAAWRIVVVLALACCVSRTEANEALATAPIPTEVLLSLLQLSLEGKLTPVPPTALPTTSPAPATTSAPALATAPIPTEVLLSLLQLSLEGKLTPVPPTALPPPPPDGSGSGLTTDPALNPSTSPPTTTSAPTDIPTFSPTPVPTTPAPTTTSRAPTTTSVPALATAPISTEVLLSLLQLSLEGKLTTGGPTALPPPPPPPDGSGSALTTDPALNPSTSPPTTTSAPTDIPTFSPTPVPTTPAPTTSRAPTTTSAPITTSRAPTPAPITTRAPPTPRPTPAPPTTPAPPAEAAFLGIATFASTQTACMSCGATCTPIPVERCFKMQLVACVSVLTSTDQISVLQSTQRDPVTGLTNVTFQIVNPDTNVSDPTLTQTAMNAVMASPDGCAGKGITNMHSSAPDIAGAARDSIVSTVIVIVGVVLVFIVLMGVFTLIYQKRKAVQRTGDVHQAMHLMEDFPEGELECVHNREEPARLEKGRGEVEAREMVDDARQKREHGQARRHPPATRPPINADIL